MYISVSLTKLELVLDFPQLHYSILIKKPTETTITNPFHFQQFHFLNHHLLSLPLSLSSLPSILYEEMRERMERLVILPFSAGCISHSSVAVCVQQPRSSKHPSPTRGQEEVEEDKESLSSLNMKSSFRLLALPKPNISTGFQRLYKSFKSFSHLFVYKEEMEEVKMEMEIGLPTDVKHVTHIGLDGSTTTNHNPMKDSLIAPEMFSLTPLSLRQFELAMAPHDAVDHTPKFTLSS